MSEFEPFDEQLSGALQRRAGSGPASVTAAHDAVLARASHIRRRRAATVGATAMTALVIGGALLLPRGASDTLAPSDTADVLPSVDAEPEPNVDDSVETVDDDGDQPDDGPTSSTSHRSTTSTDVSVTSSGEPAVAPVTVDTSVTGTTVAGTVPATPNPTPVTTTMPDTTSPATSPSTTDAAGTSTTDTSTSIPDSSTSTSEPDPPSIPPFTKTYNSSGGSISIAWNGSAFSLLSVAPAPGFDQEIEDNEPLRIRVRFRGDDDDSRIEVRVSDGELVEIIS